MQIVIQDLGTSLGFVNSENNSLIRAIPKNIYTIAIDDNDSNHIRICSKENSESNIFDFYFSDVVDPVFSDVNDLITQVSQALNTNQTNYGINIISSITQTNSKLDSIISNTNNINAFFLYETLTNYNVSINDNFAYFNTELFSYEKVAIEINGTINGTGGIDMRLQQSIFGQSWEDVPNGQIILNVGNINNICKNYTVHGARLRIISTITGGSPTGFLSINLLVKR